MASVVAPGQNALLQVADKAWNWLCQFPLPLCCKQKKTNKKNMLVIFYLLLGGLSDVLSGHFPGA